MRNILFVFSLFIGLFFTVSVQQGHAAGDSEVEKKLKSLAKEQVKAECAACKVTVECKWIAPALASRSAHSISVLQFSNVGVPAGYVTAKVGVEGKGISASPSVQFYISVQQKLPVASRSIDRGAAITKRDLQWQWKDVSRLNRQPVGEVSAFEGKTAARMISKGNLIYPTDLLSVTSIKPGDSVSMLYGKEGVQIHINCTAREAKGVGEEIRLYSKETGRRYMAKIISENKIIWVRTL